MSEKTEFTSQDYTVMQVHKSMDMYQQVINEGGTLRDKFAMAALTGFLSCPHKHNWNDTADFCYRYADALLAQRNKK